MNLHLRRGGTSSRPRATANGAHVRLHRHYNRVRSLLTSDEPRCLIVGAGDTGESMLRQIHRTRTGSYEVVGFLDDDRLKHGLSIHGVPVLGGTDSVRSICEQQEVAELLIAVPSLPPKRLRQIVKHLHGLRIRFRMVASMKPVIEDDVAFSRTPPVDYLAALSRWLEAIRPSASIPPG